MNRLITKRLIGFKNGYNTVNINIIWVQVQAPKPDAPKKNYELNYWKAENKSADKRIKLKKL